MIIALILTACIPQATTQPPTASPQPTAAHTATERPTETTQAATQVATQITPTETFAPTTEPSPKPPESQRIEFLAEDGTQLVGSYTAGLVDPAPAVILMHQFGSDHTTWERNGLAAWLQNTAVAQGEVWPAVPGGHSFAVFSFDFRGHGESTGSRDGERADFLMDAKAALATVRELPGVDPEHIVLIGASIGADAAIDACVQGCLGALSLSPGSYLDVPYAEVVTEMGLENKPAFCLAAEDDAFSADTCRSAVGDSYRSVIYAQGGHGEALLKPGMEPPVAQVIWEFLTLAFNL
jgi:dienelactone hydrolase